MNLFFKSLYKLFSVFTEKSRKKSKNDSNMHSYQGAVFFVDILGFSALTKGLVNGITDEDYAAWGVRNADNHANSFLAATILVEFRDVLHKLKSRYPNINVGQLSDCAFIWSDDVLMVLQAMHFVMWAMIRDKGILCRGGVAYGEIVDVDNANYNLGAFVVGDAVTRAVKNEGRLKGPRVAMDVTFPDVLWSEKSKSVFINHYSVDLFHPNESEIDLTVVDEYRWYLCEDSELLTVRNLSFNDCVDLTKKRLQLSNVLRFHPRMGWNSRGAEGLLQLQAGMKSLTANRILNVLHNFEMSIVDEQGRKQKRMESMNVKIDNDKYYHTSEENLWKAGLLDLD